MHRTDRHPQRQPSPASEPKRRTFAPPFGPSRRFGPALLSLVALLALTCLPNPAAARQPTTDFWVQRPTPAWGLLTCWHVWDETYRANHGFMEDPVVCGIATEPKTNKMIVTKTTIKKLIAADWELIDVERKGSEARHYFLSKPKP